MEESSRLHYSAEGIRFRLLLFLDESAVAYIYILTQIPVDIIDITHIYTLSPYYSPKREKQEHQHHRDPTKKMPSLNPKVVRHLFTELALHLDIDEDEHPSDIIQATLREIESLKRDHASLQKAYKALQNGTLSDLLEAMLNRNEELEHENETLQKLQKRYTFLKEVYKALQGEHVFLRMERKEYGALQMYQEELVGLYDSYIKGIEDSAREFMGALARVLGVGEAGLSREVIFGMYTLIYIYLPSSVFLIWKLIMDMRICRIHLKTHRRVKTQRESSSDCIPGSRGSQADSAEAGEDGEAV